ncbi:MAG: terpene cyclase/mutase family protein [Bifidobacteriaceae bacterium]|nr:terpene cyclase/mutase family protein [Bifidobacteriaceae bacterium]
MSALKRCAAGFAAVLILAVSGGLAAPALAEPDPPAVEGAACQAGQGVTVVVDFSPVRDEVDIRCAPDAAGSIREAFAAAGFDLGASGAFISEIDGVDAAQLGEQGWWGLFTSTVGGTPGGGAAADWQTAWVGADAGPVWADEAYFFRLFDSWSCDDPVACSPRVPLAEVLGRQGTGSAPPPAPVTPATGSAAAAAGWLGRQLAASGDVLIGNGVTDWGLTVDALLALAATGVGADQAAATAAKLGASGEDYIGAPGEIGAKWAAVAKLALALQVAGLDPAGFQAGGAARNLVADLRGALNGDGSFGTGDNAFSHPIALIVLARTDGGAPPAAVNWLAAQQCADAANPAFGSFGWAPDCSSPDPDATAMAIQGLIAGGLAPGSQPVADAAAWLAGLQESDGGFPSPWSGANANTTGLGASALALAGGHDSAVQAAAGYAGGLQVTCGTLATAAAALTEAQVGAIAMDQAGLEEAVEFGIDQVNGDQFRRATAQAVFAFGTPPLAALTLDGAAAALPAASCAEPSASPSQSAGASTTGAPSPSTSPTGTLPVTGPLATSGLPLAAIATILAGAALVAHRRRANTRMAN